MSLGGSCAFPVLQGHVRNDDAVETGFLATSKEGVDTIMEDGIEVGQKTKGICVSLRTRFTDQDVITCVSLVSRLADPLPG